MNLKLSIKIPNISKKKEAKCKNNLRGVEYLLGYFNVKTNSINQFLFSEKSLYPTFPHVLQQL